MFRFSHYYVFNSFMCTVHQVDQDPDSVSYGQLTVDSFEDVNVFESRTELGNKIRRVQGYLDDTRDVDTCKRSKSRLCLSHIMSLPTPHAHSKPFSVLSQFTTACSDDQCDSPNIQTTQLAVSQVCDAVDTRIRLSIEVMGRFYDFQNVAHKTKLIGNVESSQDVCPAWPRLSREECRNAALAYPGPNEVVS